ncbi:hypothetical protein [Gordonia sp. NPDC003376]
MRVWDETRRAGQHKRSAAGEPPGAGAQTPWSQLGIGEVLGILETMDGGAARGDVEALRTAIAAVRAVAHSLRTAFGDDQLIGLAANSAVERAASLAARIDNGVDSVEAGADAIESAAGVVTGAQGNIPWLRVQQQRLRDHPDTAASIRSAVSSTMSGTYSSPMIAVSGTLPSPGAPAEDSTFTGTGAGDSTQSSGIGGGGGDLGGGRGQSGLIADVDDPGGGGPGGSGPPSAAVAPTGAVPVSAVPAVPSVPGGGPPTGAGRGGDDAAVLTRGGLGAPQRGGRGVGAPSDDVGGGSAPSAAGPAEGGGSGSGAGEAGIGVPAVQPIAFAPPTVPPAPAGGVPAGAGVPSAGAPGMRPAMPAGGAPGGGGGGRDLKHRPPGYLHHDAHGREIVGDLPLVGPAVLGDWGPQAMPPITEPGDPILDLPVDEVGSQAIAGDLASDADDSVSDVRASGMTDRDG